MKLHRPFAFDDEQHLRWQSLLGWVALVLLLISIAGIVGRDCVSSHVLRHALLTLHRSAGLSVLFVTLLRIVTAPLWRLDRAVLSQRFRMVVLAAHALLYLALIATPLLGWALTSARGQTALFLGAIPLPYLLHSNADLAARLVPLHRIAALMLIAAILLRAATLGVHLPRRASDAWRRWPLSRRSARAP